MKGFLRKDLSQRGHRGLRRRPGLGGRPAPKAHGGGDSDMIELNFLEVYDLWISQ